MEVINNVTASSYTTEYRKTETNNHEVFNAAKENVSDADKRLLGVNCKPRFPSKRERQIQTE